MGRCRYGVLSFDPPPLYTKEVVGMFLEPGGERSRLIVRQGRRAPGESLDAFVARILGDGRGLEDFALTESSAMRVGGRAARKIRVRSRTAEGVLAQTIVFVESADAQVVSFACATTRASEETREAVTTAQWALLSDVLDTVQFKGAPEHDASRAEVP